MPAMDLQQLTPPTLDTLAPDSVVIAVIPATAVPAGCAADGCFEAAALVLAYYTGRRRDGCMCACSYDHLLILMTRRRVDLFPGVLGRPAEHCRTGA